ncbi:MAG: two-component regulator propeller domain-containing protein [Calditrichaceae bacterium]
MPSNFINALCEDSQGNLWIGTDFGLNKLDSKYLKMGTQELLKQKIHFIRFNTNLWNIESLSDNIVKSIVETNGYIWIGTSNGLNRFDPNIEKFKRFHSYNPKYTRVYDPRIFKLIANLKNSSQSIASIKRPGHFADDLKKIYIPHKMKVLVYCHGEGRSEFRGEKLMAMYDYGYIKTVPDQKAIWKMNFLATKYGGGAEKNRVQIQILTLAEGNYYLGYKSDDSHAYADWNNTPPDLAEDWGIHLYRLNADQEKKAFEFLEKDYATKRNSISDNYITSIAKCKSKNQLWIGTSERGMNKFDIESEKFTHYLHDSSNKNSLINNSVNTLFEDEDCILWIGTSGGISRFDERNNTFNNYIHDPLNTNSISSNFVYAIYKDFSGILWCGTYWGGIDKLDFKAKRFEHIKKNISSSSKLAENNFQSLCQISNDLILIGTWGDGLIIYNRRQNKFTNYYHRQNDRNSLSNNYIRAIFKDSNDEIWIGTYGGGLNKFNYKQNKFKRYLYDSRDPNSISSNYIFTIFRDRRGFLWIGTDGGGLNRLNSVHVSFTRYQHDPAKEKTISSNDVYCLYEDSNNNFWIGTASGLDLLNFQDTTFNHYLQDHTSSISLSNHYIYSILETQHGRDSSMWIGTAGGLYRFDYNTGQTKRYTEENGLPNRVICGILEDDNGFLWISTNKGLARFDPKMKMFTNYDLADGLQSNMFNIGACYRFGSGELGFGGINGLNIFQPDNIISNTYVPPIYIIGIKKFDQPIQLDRELTDLDEIELAYDDNYFTIEFAALDYSHPEKNDYAYILEGVNDRWIHSKNENTASYTNINPGKYVFKVRGTNSDGVWNMKGDELTILIKPPFWMSWWFRTVIIIIITFALAITVYIIIKREKQKTAVNKKISELKLQALQAQMNPHFIFNTINAIQYFINKKDNESAYFYLSKFSRLLRRTLENSEKLNISLAEEIETLKIYLELQLLRYGNKFSYKLDIDPQIDIHMIEIPSMMLQPYIENAIQHGFTSRKKGGELILSLKQNNKKLVCSIEDNGIGIKKSLLLKKRTNSGHASAGMKLSRDRLEIINTANKDDINISIEDLSETDQNRNGPRVTLQIPV